MWFRSNKIILLLTIIGLFLSLSGLPERPNSPIESKKEGESSSMYSSLPTSDAPGNGRQMQVYLHFSVLFSFFNQKQKMTTVA